MKQASLRMPWSALSVGLLFRLLMLWLVDYSFTVGDASAYRRSALTLIDHGVYSLAGEAPWAPTALRPPLYPAFEALIALVHRAPLALQLVQIALSLLGVWLLWRVALKLVPDAAPAVLWLGALNPFDAVYAGAGLSECLVVVAIDGAVAALLLTRSRGGLIATGLLLGACCLVRDIFVPLVPVAGVLFIIIGPRAERLSRFRAAAIVCVVSGAVVLPWTIRNALQFGKFIPVSAGRLGYSLWIGTWATNADFTASDATGRTYPPEAYLEPGDREAVARAEADLQTGDETFRRLFRERIAQEPLKVLGRWLIRWPRLWLGTRFDIFDLHRVAFPRGSPQWLALKAALWLCNAVFVVGSCVGLVISFRRRSLLAWAAVPLAFTGLIHLPLNSFENRYSQPMFPFMVLLSSVALTAALQRLRARGST